MFECYRQVGRTETFLSKVVPEVEAEATEIVLRGRPYLDGRFAEQQAASKKIRPPSEYGNLCLDCHALPATRRKRTGSGPRLDRRS